MNLATRRRSFLVIAPLTALLPSPLLSWHRFLLTNSGSTVLTISSISLTGANPGDFAEISTCPIRPNTLAARSSCRISVTFVPTATGSRRAGVAINDNAAGSPQKVSLSGAGIATVSLAGSDMGSVKGPAAGEGPT